MVLWRGFPQVAIAGVLVCLLWPGRCRAADGIIFETRSEFSHIQVIRQQGFQILSFDGSRETRMSLRNPLEGHFEYIDYFHMPWVWNKEISKALMIGLGGGSIQRLYLHYYPKVSIDTVEIDPAVVRVAKEFFHVPESDRHHIHVEDGRKFVERTDKRYDVILMDAYSREESGSCIPYHLATREFFELARMRMSTNGILAYNVIGSPTGVVPGSVMKSMSTVFPRLYRFPAASSFNVVLVATVSPEPMDAYSFQARARQLVASGQVKLPEFLNRARVFEPIAPQALRRYKVLTDADKPPDGMLRTGW